MKRNKLHRSRILSPFAATTRDGEILDLKKLLALLKEEITLISDVAELHLTPEIRDIIKGYIDEKEEQGSLLPQNAEIARQLGIIYPTEFYYSGRSGRSRVNKMFGARVVSESKSWVERIKVIEGNSNKYISQGWKRTVNSGKPRNLSPKINLGDTDKQYSSIEIIDDVIVLELVVQGSWYKLYFNMDERFQDIDDLAKPSITIDDNGLLKFSFPVIYDYYFTFFSTQYVVGIDVGINKYVTLTVYDIQNKKNVFTTTLSQRVHSLTNKVRKTNTQIASLQKKGRGNEAIPHRESNVRRKKELAILAAKEIAFISHEWGNAIVVFEDLSWVSNTMQNGRWNRGELVNRTIEQVELNGGRVVKTSAVNTSQECCHCHQKITHLGDRLVKCSHCDVIMDRDENASSNIAQRLVTPFNSNSLSVFDKMVRKRNQSKNKDTPCVLRTRGGSGVSLKYPGRDRTKNKPTPKRPRKAREEVCNLVIPMCSGQDNDDPRVALDLAEGSVPCGVTIISSTKNSDHNNQSLLKRRE